VGPGAERTFDAQSSFVLALPGEPGSFIFMADRWDKNNLAGSGYLWLPFQIKDSIVEIKNIQSVKESPH